MPTAVTSENAILQHIKAAVHEALEKHGTPDKMPRVKSIMRYIDGDLSDEVECANCGAYFKPRRRWQRFCEGNCRDKWHHARKP